MSRRAIKRDGPAIFGPEKGWYKVGATLGCPTGDRQIGFAAGPASVSGEKALTRCMPASRREVEEERAGVPLMRLVPLRAI